MLRQMARVVLAPWARRMPVYVGLGGAAAETDAVVHVVAVVAEAVATGEDVADAVEGATTDAAGGRLAGTIAAILPLPDIATQVK